MRNKKILNICLLTIALLTFITFIIPLKKFEAELGDKTIIKVMFYLTNSIMLASVGVIIVLSIINLFKDSYNFVLLMETMSLISMVLVFINLLMFATLFNFKINIGYLLVAIEVFALSNFSQISRLMSNRKNMAINLNFKKELNKNIKTKGSEVEIEEPKYNNEPNKNNSEMVMSQNDKNEKQESYNNEQK